MAVTTMEDVFRADPMSAFQVFSQPGLGFYIPAYQRPYGWGEVDVDRTIEDASHGLRLLSLGAADAITFIGTLLLIPDTKYETVAPQVVGQLPTRVMLVIDGQQRLTTLLLINAALHSEITRRASRLEPKIDDSAINWLREQTLPIRSHLEKSLFEDMLHGDSSYRYYPRIVRAFRDSWSRVARTAKYESPIATFLHQFATHATGKTRRPFKYEIPVESGSSDEHQLIKDNFKHALSRIKNGISDIDQDIEMLSYERMADEAFQVNLMNSPFPPEVNERLRSTSDDELTREFKELMRLVLFARFLLDRVAVTLVAARNEQYAFDMFEALNTTGQPLTAYDTFKPRVINREELAKYENSPSHQALATVESYLGKFKKAEEKHDATARLLVPFSLAETGYKLSKRLSEQRRYLKDEYDKLKCIQDARDFVQHLAHTALFIEHAWPEEAKELPAIAEAVLPDQELVTLCLEILRAAKHTVTIAPLVRFFSALRIADSATRAVAATELGGALKSAVAFFALWRGSRSTTDNIDAHYRALMERGIESIGVDAFARRTGKAGAAPNVASLQSAFRHILKEKGGIVSRDEWVRRASSLPLYKTSVPLAKFMLLISSHDTHPDPNNPGLVLAAKAGTLPLLSCAQWRGLTVEHIAPQSIDARSGEKWDKELYKDGAEERLGNLALLPANENASVSDRAWPAKRLFYSVLSAPTGDVLSDALARARAEGIEISEGTEEILKGAAFLPQLAALAKIEGDWTPTISSVRSVRLAELAWDRLAPWLGLA